MSTYESYQHIVRMGDDEVEGILDPFDGDTIITVPNDRLLSLMNKNSTLVDMTPFRNQHSFGNTEVSVWTKFRPYHNLV